MTNQRITREQAIDALNLLGQVTDNSFRYTMEVRNFIQQLEQYIVGLESNIAWLEREMFGDTDPAEPYTKPNAIENFLQQNPLVWVSDEDTRDLPAISGDEVA